MKKCKVMYLIIAIVFGLFLMVYGGVDDSPGGQLLGFLLAVAAIAGLTRIKKKPRSASE